MKVDTRRLVWLMLKNNAGIYSLHTVIFLVNAFVPFLPGLIARAFFDSLSGSQAAGYSPWTLVAMFFLVGISHAGLFLAAGPVDVYRAFLTVSTLRKNLIDRLLELPGARALTIPPGDALNRVHEDVDEIEDFLSNVPDILGNALATVTAVVILAEVNARLTGLVLLPVIAVVLLARGFGRHLEEYRRRAREAAAEASLAVSEAFNSVQAIQVAGAEEFIRKRVDGLNERRRLAAMKDLGLTVALSAVEGGASSIGTGALLLLAADQMGGSHLTVGDFTLFVSYLVAIADSSSYFGEWLARYRQTRVGFDRLATLLQGKDPAVLVEKASLSFTRDVKHDRLDYGTLEAAAPEERGQVLLSATGVTVSYDDRGPAVRGAAIEVLAGELTVIAGRVGSGKTTFLRGLLGLLPLDSGTVSWRGKTVDDPTSFFRPPVAAFARQSPVLQSLSLAENVAGDEIDEARLLEALRRSTMDYDVSRMDAGVRTQVGPRGQKLSGGQLARVAAARAIYCGASLLVFDDLSSSLDIETEQEFWKRVMDSGAAGRPVTCLTASNRPLVLRMADRILVMKDGEIVDSGNFDSLLGSSEEFRLLYSGHTAT